MPSLHWHDRLTEKEVRSSLLCSSYTRPNTFQLMEMDVIVRDVIFKVTGG